MDATHLETHKQDINAAFPGVKVYTKQLDAANEAAVKALVADAVGTHGRLDVFFANAGITGPLAHFTDITEEAFMQNMRTNVLR